MKGQQTAAQIAEQCECHEHTTWRWLSRMEKLGLVKRIKGVQQLGIADKWEWVR